ncbi:hypothetical protein CK203_044027 [Vitis vinifera]|uniref:Integrase catalytic domain-containing protein n=1 Tax=Vitis vinifera TaxID=29760 RepID=A0A438HM89_VITVI|nr:hypothetical protein CK203_044027 [Vitis vinifera]
MYLSVHGDCVSLKILFVWKFPYTLLWAATSSFSLWSCLPYMHGGGVDIIGKVSLKSSNRHEYILVAIDYFIKWVEATSYVSLTAAKVAKFIKSHIICQYGIPHELISNRGTNGAVEAANKNIKRILQKMVVTSQNWSKKLSFALWAYRTSIGATPFSLVYGMEVVLPVEIEVVHGFSFLHLASSLRLSLSFVFIVSSRPSFVFPGVMMMRSRPSISNQVESLGSHDSLIFDITHLESWYYLLDHPEDMRSRVCFNIFHLDKLRPLVEVRDVGRPLFLEDIEESHNAFSIQSSCL